MENTKEVRNDIRYLTSKELAKEFRCFTCTELATIKTNGIFYCGTQKTGGCVNDS